MADNRHIRSEDYVQVRDDDLSAEPLALRIHDHLLTACPTCATAYAHFGRGHSRIRDLIVATELARTDPAPSAANEEQTPSDPEASAPEPAPAGWIPEEIPDEHLSCFSEEARCNDEALDRIRTVRRRARKEVWKLQQVAPEKRLGKIRRAISQYRHRATAEYLLDRAKELLYDDPAEAANLASLVPSVVHWTPGSADADWSRDLTALAEAWHATALGATGDLAAADNAFSELRRKLAREPVESNAVLGEIHAQEASLRIDQQRFDEAHELLDIATALLRQTGDVGRLARVLLRHAHLLQALGRDEEALHAFESAETCLRDFPRTSWERLVAVTGCIVQLADLGRTTRAGALLEAHLDALEECGILHAGPLIRGLRGRIALARGDLRSAEHFLRCCRDGYLTMGRHRDAVLVSLDLADLYRRSQRPADLQALARELLPICQELSLRGGVLAGLSCVADGSLPADRSTSAIETLRRGLRLQAGA